MKPKQTHDYLVKSPAQITLLFRAHVIKICPEQLVIISPGSTVPVGNVAFPRRPIGNTRKSFHSNPESAVFTINVLFPCVKTIGKWRFGSGEVIQFPRIYPKHKSITKTDTTRIMIFISVLKIFALNIITINNTTIQVNNMFKKYPTKTSNAIIEIINPASISMVPIVNIIKALFSILFTLQKHNFIINFFGRLSVNEENT